MNHHIFLPTAIALIIVLALMQPGYSQTITWTGSTDTDWHKECNWNPNTRVPGCTDDVSIPNTANKPVITGKAHCKTIDIAVTSGASLSITGIGSLDISSINSGGCSGLALENSGCTVPGSQFCNFTSCFLNFWSNCTGPCHNITNGTDFDVTIHLLWGSYNVGNPFVVSAKSSRLVCRNITGFGCNEIECPDSFWSSADGSSGTIATCF